MMIHVELSQVKQMAAMMCQCGCFSTWHHNYPRWHSLTYLQLVWISSSPEVCHYFFMSSYICLIQGSFLMETKQIIITK